MLNALDCQLSIILHTETCNLFRFEAFQSWVDESEQKKKISMSQRCHAHLFFDARLTQLLIFYCLFFYQFSWTCLSKYTWKDMADTIKHWQLLTDFSNSLIDFNLVSCTSKNQVPYFILDKLTDSNWTLLLRGKNVLIVRSSNLSQALRHRIIFV